MQLSQVKMTTVTCPGYLLQKDLKLEDGPQHRRLSCEKYEWFLQ